MESIGIVLKDIMGNSAVFIAGKEAVIVSAVSIVISVFIGILGLKLIRVWNAVIGFVAGALLGFAVTYLMGLEVVPVLIAAGVAVPVGFQAMPLTMGSMITMTIFPPFHSQKPSKPERKETI